jgi:hypothetical protein
MIKITDAKDAVKASFISELADNSFQNVMHVLNNVYTRNAFKNGIAFVTTENGVTHEVNVSYPDEEFTDETPYVIVAMPIRIVCTNTFLGSQV